MLFGSCLVCQDPPIFAERVQKVLTKLCPYSNNIAIAEIEGGQDGNSLLYEVQEKEGDKQPAAGHAQESQAGHSRCLSGVRDKSIQNRETLSILGGQRVSKDSRTGYRVVEACGNPAGDRTRVPAR